MGLDNFGVRSKIFELLATVIQFTHKQLEFCTVDRCFNVEIEAVLEFTLRYLTALQLYKVDTSRIETREDVEERTGTVGNHHHDTCAVCT